VTRLTSRDFKKTARRPLELARWRELAIGALVGAVATAALFGYAHRAPAPAAEKPRPDPHRVEAAASDAAEGGAPPGATAAGQHYDFYQMLPNFEVVVPEKERDVKRNLPAAKIERPGVYVLQAGSYRNQQDAERVAKQLSLQGIPAKVQRVAVDTDVWHRVRIGPIGDLNELNRVRRELQQAEVDAIVIRVGD
jgi:cell division protein FtsN